MRIVIITLLFPLLFACKEDEKPITTIQGTVVNIGSREEVDSVMVVAVDGAESDKAQMIKYTDSLGKFSVSVEGYRPCIYLVKDGYRFVVFSEGHGSSDNFKSYLPDRNYKNEVLELWAEAYFNPMLKGNNCESKDTILFDVISYFYLSKEGFEHQYLGNGPFRYMEWDNDGYPGIGDKYLRYWIKYQVHGVWQERIDSVYIPSFTTYTDTIYY